MPATQREIPGRPTREGKDAPPLPAPLPSGNAESAVFARAEQYVRGVLLVDSAMQGSSREYSATRILWHPIRLSYYHT